MKTLLRMNTGESLNWDSGLFRTAIVFTIPAMVWGFGRCTSETQIVAGVIAVACPVVLVWAVFVAVKFIGRGFMVD